jgi:glycosyltransferase involved in cell wall biosynthesis
MHIVILSTSTLGETDLGAVRRRAQWARAALRCGERVLFVEAAASDAPLTHPNLTLHSLAALGFSERALRRAWHGLDPENLETWQAAFARALDAFGQDAREGRVAIVADPFIPFAVALPLLQARGYRTVYDCLDDFEALAQLGYSLHDAGAEQFLARECDLTAVVTSVLAARLGARAPQARIRLVPQGYDDSAFPRRAAPPPPPTDLPRGARTLGFWGHVNDFNVDTGLLTYLAQARPDWAFVLLGPVDADPARPAVGATLRAQPNIHLPGAKPHGALAGYLAGFDAALVPYPAHAFNAARGPLKVYEYLAGYKPVIASHTPQLEDVPYVYRADTPEAFLAQIETALTISVARERVDAFLAQGTWDARWQQLLRELEASPRREAPPSSPDPARWYEKHAPAANMRAYIAATEQLLEERTRAAQALEADARAKERHIEQLERTNLLWRLKQRLFG